MSRQAPPYDPEQVRYVEPVVRSTETTGPDPSYEVRVRFDVAPGEFAPRLGAAGRRGPGVA